MLQSNFKHKQVSEINAPSKRAFPTNLSDLLDLISLLQNLCYRSHKLYLSYILYGTYSTRRSLCHRVLATNIDLSHYYIYHSIQVQGYDTCIIEIFMYIYDNTSNWSENSALKESPNGQVVMS